MTYTTQHRDWRLLALLVALAVVAALSLALVPFETLPDVPPDIPRIAFVVQPAILAVVGAALGWWAAPKVGISAPALSALAHGRMPSAPARKTWLSVGGVALATASILVGFSAATEDVMLEAVGSFEIPLVTRLFYGGVGEELIMRGGVLSAIALGLTKLSATPAMALWIANAFSAALFAVSHFGMLFAFVPDPSAGLMAATFAGNFVPGLLFGWLFITRGLDSAIAGHAGAHLIAWCLSLVVQ